MVEVVGVRDGNTMCLDLTGTSLTTGSGSIELDTDAAADLRVVQNSAADLSARNNGIPVVELAHRPTTHHPAPDGAGRRHWSPSLSPTRGTLPVAEQSSGAATPPNR